MANKTILLTQEEASGKLIEELFDTIAEKMGADPKDPAIRYDCRKLEIASNIQELIYKAYEERYPLQYKESPSSCRESVTIALLQYGPKENPGLPPYTITYDDAFLVGVKPRVTITDKRKSGKATAS